MKRLLAPSEKREPGLDGASPVDDFHCITRDADEPAPQASLAVCDDNPVHVTCSVRCPSECGGHLICDPCYQRGIADGLIKPKGE